MKNLNSVKIKSIKKIDVDPNEFRYSINVEENHNYFLNNGILSKNCVVLIDECQNLTRDHLITILTRIGTYCKMILMGDTDQIDRRTKSDSGFNWVIDRCKNIEEIGITTFTDEDIVRNPVISKILEATKNETV